MNQSEIPLGRKVDAPKSYDPSLLYPLPRKRPQGEDQSSLPQGIDRWDCFEVSWLSSSGAPVVMHTTLSYSASSRFIIESKSLKLYLSSFCQEKFSSPSELAAIVKRDLVKALDGEEISLSLRSVHEDLVGDSRFKCGVLIDDSTLTIDCYLPNKSLLTSRNLSCDSTGNSNLDSATRHRVYSNCFRSLCPVTSQPDWATIVIDYVGEQLPHDELFAYLASYRQHQGFHEECADMLYADLKRYCNLESLSLGCYFVRRGGIAITPIRWGRGDKPPKELMGILLGRQ